MTLDEAKGLVRRLIIAECNATHAEKSTAEEKAAVKAVLRALLPGQKVTRNDVDEIVNF